MSQYRLMASQSDDYLRHGVNLAASHVAVYYGNDTLVEGCFVIVSSKRTFSVLEVPIYAWCTIDGSDERTFDLTELREVILELLSYLLLLRFVEAIIYFIEMVAFDELHEDARFPSGGIRVCVVDLWYRNSSPVSH